MEGRPCLLRVIYDMLLNAQWQSSQSSIFHRPLGMSMLFIHSSVICQTTGPQPPPKRFLHLMRSRASAFKWQYPLLSPRSSSNCLRLLLRLLVTSIRPCIFPSITSFRRQFLRKMWPIQLAFRFLISCRIFLCSLTLLHFSFFISHMIGPTDLLHPSPTPQFETFQVFLIYCPNRPSFSTTQSHAQNVAFH
jgi:hypothetical protein